MQGATKPIFNYFRVSTFQSTHPCRVRRPNSNSFRQIQYFNPRTHAGCDQALQDYSPTFAISIHAPMQGATLVISYIGIIIHHFNPRTHAGCDQRACGDNKSIFISIHAPMQGATVNILVVVVLILFQSTHPCRVRPLLSNALTGLISFQSTHPCRVRHVVDFLYHIIYHFNPRTHAGCDS